MNGIDTSALLDAVNAISDDPAKGLTSWQVPSHWRGGTRSNAIVRSKMEAAPRKDSVP
jgi:hypothetical protein